MPAPSRAAGDSVTGAPSKAGALQPGRQPQLSRRLLQSQFPSRSSTFPIGPNNRIEPAAPDMGQPTHFLPGRQWGMFTVPAPKEFKADRSATSGRSSPTARARAFRCALTPTTSMSPFKRNRGRQHAAGAPASSRTARRCRARSPASRRRRSRTGVGLDAARDSRCGRDDMKYTERHRAPTTTPTRPPVVECGGRSYRGPGAVTFDKARPEVEKLPSEGSATSFSGKATVHAKFSRGRRLPPPRHRERLLRATAAAASAAAGPPRW